MEEKAVDEFVENQLKLLKIEESAEKSQKITPQSPTEIESCGVGILNLTLERTSTAFNGQKLLILTSNPYRKYLPASKITKGDYVSVYLMENLTEKLVKCVVWAVKRDSLVLLDGDSLNQTDLAPDLLYAVVKKANYATFSIMRTALLKLKNSKFELRSIFFDLPETNTDTDHIVQDMKKINFFDKHLNETQKEVIKFAISQPNLAIIKGPPGTGKSTTLIEIIRQSLTLENTHILVVAPSNVAVDNLVDKFRRLNIPKISFVRLGNEARVLESNLKYSISHQIEHSMDYGALVDLRNEILNFRGVKKEFKKYQNLIKDYKSFENKLVGTILSQARIVFSTMASVAGKHSRTFDLVIIDESSQALEALSWVVLPLARKCIMAGDCDQLPPTLISKEAAKSGLSVSLMERMTRMYPTLTKLLTIQYRMHAKIMTFSSTEFYHGKLVPDSSVESHLLCQFQNVKATDFTSSSLILVDTSYCGLFEADVGTTSKCNLGEVEIVGKCVSRLLAAGVSQKLIGIISFYSGQVEMLRKSLAKLEDLEINSVDSFQGREKEVIIISFVRSSQKCSVGFLDDYRRINVALTRARRLLVLVMDSATLDKQSLPFLSNMVKHFTETADIRLVPEDFVCDDSVFIPPLYEKKVQKSVNNADSEFEQKMAKLMTFLAAEKTDYIFDVLLTKQQRRIVYQISEKFECLDHETEGTKSKRKKVKIFTKPEFKKSDLEVENGKNDCTSTKLEDLANIQYIVTDKLEIKEEFDDSINSFAKLNIEVTKNDEKTSKDSDMTLNSFICKKKVSNTEKINKNRAKNEISDCFKINEICNAANCRRNTKIIFNCCRRCRLVFCFDHHLPEVHGCIAHTLSPPDIKPRPSASTLKTREKTKKAISKRIETLQNQRKRK